MQREVKNYNGCEARLTIFWQRPGMAPSVPYRKVKIFPPHNQTLRLFFYSKLIVCLKIRNGFFRHIDPLYADAGCRPPYVSPGSHSFPGEVPALACER